jgi:crossover junction endodeoxyribonuclease RuvC
MRILGIDPGSRLLGYGCVEWARGRITTLSHGTLRVASDSADFADRLLRIHEGLGKIIRETRPEAVVVERVFFAKNAVSALKLGQGAILLTARIHGLAIAEYSATEVKQSLAGYGRADKSQVAQMVGMIAGPMEFETSDASDALALAICHAFRQGSSQTREALLARPTGRKKRMSLAESVGLAKPKGTGGIS